MIRFLIEPTIFTGESSIFTIFIKSVKDMVLDWSGQSNLIFKPIIMLDHDEWHSDIDIPQEREREIPICPPLDSQIKWILAKNLGKLGQMEHNL